ncbi:MAG: 50S ribosomal protein L18Ae [Methanoregulaceae archaeon]
MAEQMFEVKGTFRMGENWKPYTKTVSAPNENQARERIFTDLGSRHRLKRRYITVNTVTVLRGE